MHKVWLVVTNASIAKIYEVAKEDHQYPITLVEEHYHPESRLKESEMVSDRPGDYQGGTGLAARGAYVPKTTHKQHETTTFAKQLITVLLKAKNANAYNALLLSAPPHFHGIIKQLLPEQLEISLQQFIDKDYTGLTLKEIEEKFSPLYKRLLATS
jgi:protein required for attachment to host cells